MAKKRVPTSTARRAGKSPPVKAAAEKTGKLPRPKWRNLNGPQSLQEEVQNAINSAARADQSVVILRSANETFAEIALEGSAVPDVDHFFPHALKAYEHPQTIDGVWNLVLACSTCNRGSKGKFDKVPDLPLLERLHRRNEFLIASHHPLRETLIAQTGSEPSLRRDFLQGFHGRAVTRLLHRWSAEQVRSSLF